MIITKEIRCLRQWTRWILEPNVAITLIAKSQCSLAVVSCSMCLSTSATDKLQLLFFLPQTTFSRPVSTLCSSEFKSLQLSKRKQDKTKQTSQQLVTQWKNKLLTRKCLLQNSQDWYCSENVLALCHVSSTTDRLKYHKHINWNHDLPRQTTPDCFTPRIIWSVHSFFKTPSFLKNISRYYMLTFCDIFFLLFFWPFKVYYPDFIEVIHSSL